MDHGCSYSAPLDAVRRGRRRRPDEPEIDLNQQPPIRVLAVSRKCSARTQGLTWALRIGNLIPHLAQNGIEVTTCELPRGRSTKRSELSRLLRDGPFEIGWLHRHISWPWEISRLRRYARDWVFDYDDPVCYQPTDSGHFSLTRWLKFRSTLRSCRAVLAATEELARLARPHCRRVELLPLSIAEPIADRPTPRQANEPLRLLWLGSRGTFVYLKNIRPQLEAIGRACPNVALAVVGHEALQLDHLAVDNIPWSFENERNWLARSHVGLVPLPDNRWTRGKATYKPLQYLAHGIPFVGSPVGVTVHLADDSNNGLLADTPDEWASAVSRLLNNEPGRRQMGELGLKLIRKNHQAAKLARRVAQVFRELTAAADLARRA